MSVLAAPALAALQRSLAAPPGVFGDLAATRPHPSVGRLETCGFAEAGRGAGVYVADGLADAALHAAHPRFCLRTANGRYFRLLAEGGSIAVEQGGAAGDGTGNDQPVIQETITYAEAIGAAEVRFESALYRLHCPARTSPFSDLYAADGHPLVVRRSLALRGCAAERTVLDFAGVDGVDPETHWQLIRKSPSDAAQVVWRGGGVFLCGDTVHPGSAPRRIERLQLERLILRGNRKRTGEYSWPANPVTGAGWDISDKALWLQNSYAGSIICRDVDMIGWKGEIFYLGGALDAVERVELDRCRFATTNASAFNPGVGCEISARDCAFGDASQAQEDSGKRLAVYRNCTWFDCQSTGIGSGPAGPAGYNYAFATRYDDQAVPMTVLDGCRFVNATILNVSSWVSGSIQTIDTQTHLTATLSGELRDVALSIEAWMDRRGNFQPLTLYGVNTLTEQIAGAPAGTYAQPPRRIALNLVYRRTALAVTQGREWLAAEWLGYLGADCILDIEGEWGATRTPTGGTNVPKTMPLVRLAGRASSATGPHGYKTVYVGQSGEFAPPGPVAAIQAPANTTIALTLPTYPTGGAAFPYAEGQKVRLVKNYDGGTFVFTKGAAANTVVLSTRTLALADDWIEFTYNRRRERWEETGFFSAA